MTRLHVCLDVPRYVQGQLTDSARLIDRCNSLLQAHDAYTRDLLDDLPEIKDWVWTE